MTAIDIGGTYFSLNHVYGRKGSKTGVCEDCPLFGGIAIRGPGVENDSSFLQRSFFLWLCLRGICTPENESMEFENEGLGR